jgi:hypothetical protein
LKKTDDLQKALLVAEQTVVELKEDMQHQSDLNIITPYITKYYSEIYRQVRREFSAVHGCQIPYNNWVELFAAASVEAEQYDNFSSDSRPINDNISNVMHGCGGLTRDDWDALQSVRTDRNSNGHPRLDSDKVAEAIEMRWKSHPAYDALDHMIQFLNKTHRHKKYQYRI